MNWVWLVRWGEDADSVHLRTFPDVPAAWRDEELAARWERIRALRRVVTGALEIERKEKRLGSSLQAHPTVHADADYRRALDGIDLAEIAITSGATLVDGAPAAGGFAVAEVPGVTVVCGLAAGSRCERCWRVLPEVGQSDVSGQGVADGTHDDLCGRCTAVVAEEATDAQSAA